VVGFLRSTPAAPFTHLVEAFTRGLAEEGFVPGQNVAIEQRWADNKIDRLPALAAELVNRPVAALVGNRPAVRAAKNATSTIPIVFVVGDDPVKSGLVPNLNRPGGNLTGVTFFGGGTLNAKRLELLHQLARDGAAIAVLIDTNDADFVRELPEVEAAGRTLGRRIVGFSVSRGGELEPAFAGMVEAGAAGLLVSGGPFFTSQRHRIVALAARHKLAAIYDLREWADAGGLISYAASISGAYRQAGVYVGRILKGDKPGDLPVQRPTQFELVINLRTARAQGISIPLSLQAAADAVIE
jgi:putative ABC transport system substrate-binding protein